MSSLPPTKPPEPRKRLPLNAAIPRQAPPPADLVAMAGQARPGAAGGAGGGNSGQPESDKPKSRRLAGLELRIGNPIEAAKALGILGALVLGLVNQFEKAPAAKAEAADTKAETAKKAIEGDPEADKKTDELGIEKRLGALESKDERKRKRDCAKARWEAEVYKRLTPPVFATVVGCDDIPADDVKIVEGPSMPNGRRSQVVVLTPMPAE
jgi:hypothetical protein